MASETRKVVVHLRATGDAPILKQAKFKIAGDDKFIKVIDFLRRQLHRETLFVYVNSAFSPNPDELVMDLYNCAHVLRFVIPDFAYSGLGLPFNGGRWTIGNIDALNRFYTTAHIGRIVHHYLHSMNMVQ